MAAGTAKSPVKRSRKKADAPVTAPLDVETKIKELEALSGRQVLDDDGGVIAVEIGRSGRTPNNLVTLFTLDGVEYKVPEKPSAALMQRFFRDVRKYGRSAAAAMLLDTMIGEEALNALSESPDVTDEDMAAIYTIVTHLAFGKVSSGGRGPDPS